jgi:hypothetical protein
MMIFVDASAFELGDQHFQDGFIADGHHRFGEDPGIGGQSGAGPAGEDDGFHN